MSWVKDKNLKNCYFLPWQPSQDLKYSLSAADISIITLTDETALVSVPSKTYNLLAVGTPLLCIASDESELAHLVAAYDCGRCFTKEKSGCNGWFYKRIEDR